MQSLTSQGFNWADYAIDADTDDPFFRSSTSIAIGSTRISCVCRCSASTSRWTTPTTAKHGVKTFTFKTSDDVGHFDSSRVPRRWRRQVEVPVTPFTTRASTEIRKSQWIDQRRRRPQDRRGRPGPLDRRRRGRRHRLRAGRTRRGDIRAPGPVGPDAGSQSRSPATAAGRPGQRARSNPPSRTSSARYSWPTRGNT